MKIAPNPKVLKWAVERSGNEDTLEHKFPKLPDWLDGSLQPTLRQLEGFAKAASVPFGYLLLQEPPQEKLSIPLFRTVDDQPTYHSGPDLLETVHLMQLRQDWMREYLIDQEAQPLPFVRSASPKDSPVQIAAKIRTALGLSETWASKYSTWTDALRALQNRIESIGILVVVNGVVGNNTKRKLDPAEFRGFVLVDEYTPLLFVNGADGKAAQMFTLAHELAHIWLGKSAAFDLRELRPADNRIEQLCNQVAAEFLVPQEQLVQFWPSVRQNPEPVQAVARHFKVSGIVAARRLSDLKLITTSEFLAFYHNWRATARASGPGNNGGDFYKTQNMRVGRRFGEMVVRATKEGSLLYNEAYRLTGLYGDTFRRYAETAFGINV
ncbi:MAG TPA: ImmA/IrrE family metallo-endopeptidase [Promineifilum sp.]|nr:ImmA/IrrE family metallo-endopeptidase [Promineifilum sp.]